MDTTSARVSAAGSSDRRPTGSSLLRLSAFLIPRRQVPLQLQAPQRHRLPQWPPVQARAAQATTDQKRMLNPYSCTSILISNPRVRWHAFFYCFQAPDTRPDTLCIRTSTAMPTHVGAALTGSPEQALLRRRETATRYTADATSRRPRGRGKRAGVRCRPRTPMLTCRRLTGSDPTASPRRTA